MKTMTRKSLPLLLALALVFGAFPMTAWAAVPSLSASPGSLGFGAVSVGYAAPPAAQTVTVGVVSAPPLEALYNVQVTSSHTAFTVVLGSGGPLTLDPSNLAETLTVQPVTGLTVGSYSETIVISGDTFQPAPDDKATISITVTFTVSGGNVPVTGVTLNSNAITLAPAGSATLTATVVPSDATNKNVTWASSNTAIATVDQNGIVTGIRLGAAIITATTADGGFTASCTVNVRSSGSVSGSGSNSGGGGSDYDSQQTGTTGTFTQMPQGTKWLTAGEIEDAFGNAFVTGGGSVMIPLTFSPANLGYESYGINADDLLEDTQPSGGRDASAYMSPKRSFLENLTIDVSFDNYTYRFMADTTGSPVQVRITIPDITKLSGDVLLSGAVKGNTVNSRRALFERFFDNQVRVVHIHQQAGFNQAVTIAAKVDFTGMDKEQLVFYAYNSEKNTYRRIARPNVRHDKNGYVHITSEHPGDIIISEGTLARKG